MQPVRTLISVAVLAGAIWAAFAIELGDKTFAEHIDTISATPEAKQLVDDTRSTVNPALGEVRDRVLGEYVEAPTWIPEQPAGEDVVHASRRPGTEPSLPGRRKSEKPKPSKKQSNTPKPSKKSKPSEGAEPRLPGRR